MTLIISACMCPGQIHRTRGSRWSTPSVQTVLRCRTILISPACKSPYPTFRTVGLPSTPATGLTERCKDFSLDTISVVGGQHPAAEKHSHAPPPDVNAFPAVDTIETAIDFVLALEHPCMTHIPYPPDPPGIDPANHMMMVRHCHEFPQHSYLQTLPSYSMAFDCLPRHHPKHPLLNPRSRPLRPSWLARQAAQKIILMQDGPQAAPLSRNF